MFLLYFIFVSGTTVTIVTLTWHTIP